MDTRNDKDAAEMIKTELSNGLTILVKEVHTAPVASFWVWYLVGSRYEHTGITGISHWVEHMLFKGTPAFPKGTADKAIAREGGVFNGMTWYDSTTYCATLPTRSSTRIKSPLSAPSSSASGKEPKTTRNSCWARS
jgi:predicted Zn-dependent peptidase